MSSPQRRRERAAEQAARDEADLKELYRLSMMSWYERIEEAETVDDLKPILHEIILTVGLV